MGFEFSDDVATLEIAGRTYVVKPYGSVILRAMDEYRRTLDEIAERDDLDASSSASEVLSACARLIDAILGTGTHKMLFAGREDDFLAHQELIGYIVGHLLALRSARVAESASVGIAAAKEVIGQVKGAGDL